MIFTIGFEDLIEAKALGIEDKIPDKSDYSDDYLFVQSKGAGREVWEKLNPFQADFELKGILPTRDQRTEISHFIMKGGTVLTPLVDPNQKIETTAYKKEIPKHLKNNLGYSEDGCTLKFEYEPYNWLNNDCNMLPFLAHQESGELDQRGKTEYSVKTTKESVVFNVGSNDGKIVFTKLLNECNSYTTNSELLDIVEKLVGEEETDVVTR